MTEKRFNKLINRTRLLGQSVEIGRRVLVLGEQPSKVARDFSVSRQRVGFIVSRIQNA